MLYAVLLFGLVYSAVGQKCCAPHRWEGGMWMLGGSAGQGRNVSYNEGIAKLSVDGIAKKVAVEEVLFVDGHMTRAKILFDYNKRIQYTIVNGTCYKAQTGPWTPPCIPENAIHFGSWTLGGPLSPLHVDWYRMLNRFGWVDISVAKGCIPVGSNSIAGYEQSGGMETYVFDDVTLGIKDPSIFTPPARCNSLTVAPLPAKLLGRFGQGKTGFGVL